MASTKSAPKRSVLIVARLVTTVVSIAGAEGVLWFGGYPSWWRDSESADEASYHQVDADLGWIDRPGQYDLAGGLRKDPFRYTIWCGGRRATATLNKPSACSGQAGGLSNVMFFGDSYVFGYGLSDAETMPWMVQARHPELEVTNFGTPGYGTYQSYLAIKRAVQQPAFVFYLLNGFHEGRNAGETSWLRVVRQPPSGFFYPYVALKHGNIEEKRSPGEMVWALARRLRTVALIEDYSEIARAYPRVRKKQQATDVLLKKMNESVTSSHGRFAVILFDLDQKQRVHYRELLSSNHISYLDCDRPELTDRRLRLPDGHPSEKLNALLAGWIDPLLDLSAKKQE